MKNIKDIELLERESYYIDKFNTFIDNRCGYNMMKKSNHKLIYSEETKEKHRGARNPFYGKRHNDETMLRMITTFKRNYKKENHPFYLKHHSDETKHKISKNKLGQKHTEKTKKQMSKSHKGMIFSKTHRENLSIVMSDKYQIYFNDGTNIIVHGLNKFARENGYSQGNLWGVSRGTRKKHKNIIKVIPLS
jgi:NUMOD3 motif